MFKVNNKNTRTAPIALAGNVLETLKDIPKKKKKIKRKTGGAQTEVQMLSLQLSVDTRRRFNVYNTSIRRR